MMKLKLTYVIILAFFFVQIGKAQDNNEFKPYAKPLVLIFSNVNTSFNSDGSSRAFELTRSYLGFEYFFSEKISSRVNFDVGDPGTGRLQMTAFVKNAYLMYKTGNFSARFGMIGTDQFSVQEKQWGYRYIYKSFQDAYNFGPSADIGAALEYSPAEFITVNLSMVNGEGFRSLQNDSTFKETIGLTFFPVRGLTLRAYYDMMNHDYNQTSYAFFAGYSFKNFRTGLEYNYQRNNGMNDQHNFSGISAYAAMNFARKYSFFARYDYLTSVTPDGALNPWNYNRDGQLFIFGCDYSPVQGVKIAPTYSGWSPENSSRPFTSTLLLNVEIKF